MKRLVILVLIQLVSACAGERFANPSPIPASVQEIPVTQGSESSPNQPIIWHQDPTVADPAAFIGTILIKRGNDINFAASSIDGLHVTPKTRPEVVRSLLVTRKNKNSFEVPGFAGLAIDDGALYSVVETDFEKIRLDRTDGTYVKSTKEWISENQDLISDPDTTLLRVDGVVFKGIAKKRYYKVSSKEDVGSFGVIADGQYFKSSEEYQLDTVFGLSVSVIKSAAQLDP